ncbi:MAG: glycerol-3-phosphate 1-O-acyltransferase PlsY [Lachnospirales bacterium]
MFRLICLLIGYGLGCLQSAYIISRAVGHIDIREYGSGNAGFTNATRVLGKKVGVWVFIIDFLKVIVAFLIASWIFDGTGTFTGGISYLPGIYAGAGAILGHNFPFYLGFRGGKGIACSLGIMLCVSWQIALITYAIGFVVFMAKKYISLSSLTMTLLFPIIMIITRNSFNFEIEAIIIMFILCALAYIKHRTNIQRLLNGTENKFGSKKK